MSISLNEVLNKGRKERIRDIRGVYYVEPAPMVECVDGYTISIQCSSTAYCSPRETLSTVDNYTAFELGFPNIADELINEYAESDDYTKTIYPYVPREVVEKLIEKHGGVKPEDSTEGVLFA